MKKIISILLLAFSSVVLAQSSPQGYLTDTNGQVVRSGTGLCWRTGYWTPANATVEGCDDFVKPKLIGAKITIQADTLFDFDKAIIKPEGKAVLDSIVASTQGIRVEIFAIVGYTDKIGSAKYNDKLSEKRANVVKSYFVAKGISEDLIITQGRGKSNPVTGKSCNGKFGNKLIECLAPDRRAIIEIIGSK